MIAGYDYAYSNYRSYARPADDGLSAWHPAYLRPDLTLDGCAGRYEQFCRRYRPEAKEQRTDCSHTLPREPPDIPPTGSSGSSPACPCSKLQNAKKA